MSNISLGLVIGATLASSFGSSISSATKSVSQLQEKSEAIFKKQKIGQAYLDIQNEIDKTGTKFEATGYKSVELGRKMVQLEQSLNIAGAEAKAAGFDLNNIGEEMRKSTIQTQRLERAMKRMQAVAARKVEIASLRMELMGYVGAGYMAARLFAKAVETEGKQFRLGTVINVDSKNKSEAMRKARIAAADVAKSGVTGFNEAFDIQYALNSAGLTSQLSRTATPVVAAVAKLTGGMQEQVGEVLATNYNNLGDRLKGTESEKFARIGDLLTKVQYKYQIRDFSQLGEGMKYAATAVNQYNVNLEQSYTAMGELNSAGLQSGMAGTGFNSMMRQLQIGASKGLISIKRMKDGQVDLVKTLEAVKKKTDGMSADKKATFIQKLAGDEGARAMVPLLRRLDSYKKNVKEVTESSRGLVGKGIADWEKTSEAGLMKLNGAFEVTGFSLKEGFLPIIGDVAASIAPVVAAFGTLAQQNPETVKMLGSVIAGFGAMKITMIGGRIAALSLMNVFSMIAAHPVVAGLLVIGLVAYQIWKHWDFLKAKFLGWWSSIKKVWAPIGEAIKAPFVAAFKWVGDKIEWLKTKWTDLKKLLSGDIATPTTKGGNPVPVPGRALGGIFDKPHVAAVCEGGKREAIIPLEGNRDRARSLFIATGTELGLINRDKQMPRHALGGIFDKPHVAAISEGGKREAIIPLEGNRARARSIYAAAGSALGIKQQYISGGSACVIKAEFNINVTSSTEGEKIAAYIKQALADLERKAKSQERGRFEDAPVFG